jgi:hypothetical protein
MPKNHGFWYCRPAVSAAVPKRWSECPARHSWPCWPAQGGDARSGRFVRSRGTGGVYTASYRFTFKDRPSRDPRRSLSSGCKSTKAPRARHGTRTSCSKCSPTKRNRSDPRDVVHAGDRPPGLDAFLGEPVGQPPAPFVLLDANRTKIEHLLPLHIRRSRLVKSGLSRNHRSQS